MKYDSQQQDFKSLMETFPVLNREINQIDDADDRVDDKEQALCLPYQSSPLRQTPSWKL